jgi:hypothetical protein
MSDSNKNKKELLAEIEALQPTSASVPKAFPTVARPAILIEISEFGIS